MEIRVVTGDVIPGTDGTVSVWEEKSVNLTKSTQSLGQGQIHKYFYEINVNYKCDNMPHENYEITIKIYNHIIFRLPAFFTHHSDS